MKKLPVMFVRDAVVYPVDAGVTLHVGRDDSIKAINHSLEHFNNKICVVAQLEPKELSPNLNDIHKYGSVCEIEKCLKFSDGTIKISLKGELAFTVTSIEAEDVSNFCEFQEMTIDVDPKVYDELKTAQLLPPTECPNEIQDRVELFKKI